MNASPALCWFRRDLRIDDHAALYRALKAHQQVFCVFVFDTDILAALPNKSDRRVEFIWHSVKELDAELRKRGGALIVRHGAAREEIPRLVAELKVQAVYANHDYEPQASARDQFVAAALAKNHAEFFTFKDQVVFEKDEVLTQASRPFTVFTPYKNAWLKKLDDFFLKAYPVEKHIDHLAATKSPSLLPSLESMGFRVTNLLTLGIKPGASGARETLQDFLPRMAAYKDRRDFPGVKGVSYLSVHNRFGTVSVRELARRAVAENNTGADSWLAELIWRDFYFNILYHFPHAAERSFKPEYVALKFENDKHKFQAWCDGKTGYPIVDAAMRQINETGFMHNRLRMIVASFLMKDLLIDWRWGEKYFADHLNDFDLAANNGGWQWAASTGCDAQPYFRIFNPITQSEKFDPEGRFILRYIPELKGLPGAAIHAPWLVSGVDLAAAGIVLGKHYPKPIVEHAAARVKALAMYGVVKQKQAD
jgi:deoxyribodipyrimidine photo-lyase